MLVRMFQLAASRHWRPSGPMLNYQENKLFIAYTTRERQSCASSWAPAARSQSQRLFTTPWSASYSSTCLDHLEQLEAVVGWLLIPVYLVLNLLGSVIPGDACIQMTNWALILCVWFPVFTWYLAMWEMDGSRRCLQWLLVRAKLVWLVALRWR